MNAIRVICDVDKEPPLLGVSMNDTYRINEGIAFTRIPAGMQNGASAVGITAKLPNGKAVYLELSMNNFLCAAAIFEGAEGATVN